MTPYPHQGRLSLVTGASSGLGVEFARQLAARGSHLVLVARRREKLEALAKELSMTHGINVHVKAMDLTTPDAARSLKAQLSAEGRAVDTLVNNAGFATYGDLVDADPARITEEIRLNVQALVELTQAFLPDMRTRGSGAVINLASTAAFQPLPHMAVYGATKAFVLSFSEALWGENRATGVRVLCLCPGATDTPFFEVVGHDEAAVGAREDPVRVVERVFSALDRNRSTVISGLKNYWMAQSARFSPREQVIRIAGGLMAPKKAPIPRAPSTGTSGGTAGA